MNRAPWDFGPAGFLFLVYQIPSCYTGIMFNATTLNNREIIFSRVVLDLVHDRETRSEIARVVQAHRKLNDEEHERLSERKVRHMLAQAIQRENPHLSYPDCTLLLERRMEAAMKPYAGPPVRAQRSPTARDLARSARKAEVRRGREGRR